VNASIARVAAEAYPTIAEVSQLPVVSMDSSRAQAKRDETALAVQAGRSFADEVRAHRLNVAQRADSEVGHGPEHPESSQIAMRSHPEEARMSVIAATAFEEERRAHYSAIADESSRELLALRLEDLEYRIRRNAAARTWAARLGLEANDVELLARVLYGQEREARIEAAQALCRRLLIRSASLRVLLTRTVDARSLWA
jgi:hypothetical protein